MELRDRERKLDVNDLSEEQVSNLSIQIGEKIRDICDEAVARVNSILAIYGMSAKMAIQFDTLADKAEQDSNNIQENEIKPQKD